MKTTIVILVLPFVMALLFLLLALQAAGDAFVIASLFLWVLTAVICFVRGCIIFRRQPALGCCCLGIALLHLVIAILPAFSSAKTRSDTMPTTTERR
jgi:endonuclease/exonuclease/phosphatase (EEP) superfamily protein YafD